MDERQSPVNINLEHLIFRRQFLLGPHEFQPNQHWTCSPLKHGLFLSNHNDLICQVRKVGNNLVALVGLAFDPYHPKSDLEDILDTLVFGTINLASVIKRTEQLSGRWVIIYQDADNTYLFNDPFGFRSIYYYADREDRWCASQPELIKTQCELTYSEDIDFLEYIHSSGFSKNESPMYGPNTIYQGCYHLLPNFFLDFREMHATRFYPDDYLPQKSQELVAEESSELLRGIFSAITHRHSTALALTSGWDSRLLLAASKDVRKKIQYFIDKKGVLPDEHPDVWVSKALANQLGLSFELRNSNVELPGWFTSLLSKNVSGARVLQKSRMIYSKYRNSDNLLYLNGNGGEIFRNYYDKNCRYDPNELEIETILQLMGFDNHFKYVFKEVDDWINQFSLRHKSRLNILDFLYWEQRIGNWGCQFPAEQDLAVEEISPLNCRLLINNFLCVSRENRAAPDFPLIRNIINNLWPEVLDLPINPPAQPQSTKTLWEKLRSNLRLINFK